MGWDAATPEQIEDMKDYIGAEDISGLTEEDLDAGKCINKMTDAEILDIIDKHGGYEAVGGGWVDTNGNSDDHVSMAPHGQWAT
jgi:hypothetical protein